eukprot:1331084-Amphidinium_carterae.2
MQNASTCLAEHAVEPQPPALTAPYVPNCATRELQYTLAVAEIGPHTLPMTRAIILCVCVCE